MAVIAPSPIQIENAELMGWLYVSDGIFSKGEETGYFTEAGFIKE